MAAKCPHCQGRRLVNDNKLVEIEVEKGMAAGDTIVLEKEAEQVPDLAKGDLIFTIRQKKHNQFSRVGDNLYMDLQITLEEALLGFSKKIRHLDGHMFEVKS
jgi:DnaJ-class molecular chaperone